MFARLREALGAPAIELPEGAQPATVAELRDWLSTQSPDEFATAIADPNVICAVNQRVSGPNEPLSPGDEVAFFPPVTGG